MKYSNCIHSALLTTFMDFWLFFTCFQLLAIYDVYKVYMSRWCRLHFLSLWNNKDIKSRSKLCTVFIKNTLTSLFVSNQNEKPQAEKNWEKKHMLSWNSAWSIDWQCLHSHMKKYIETREVVSNISYLWDFPRHIPSWACVCQAINFKHLYF